MTSTIRVSEIKSGRVNPNKCNVPRPNTQLRRFYDELQKHKGERFVWECSNPKVVGYWIANLNDFYGLDVRQVGGNWKRGGPKTSGILFAGEWFGRVYVDYVAERLKMAV